MLSIPQFVADVPTSGFYGLYEGQVVPLMRDSGTLYRVAWASSSLPEGFESWTAPGVDLTAPWPLGDVVGRMQVSEDAVSSMVSVHTWCEWKNATWSVIAKEATRFRIQSINFGGDRVSRESPPGPGRGDWDDWPGVVSWFGEPPGIAVIDQSEASAVRIKRQSATDRSSKMMLETFFVPSPAVSSYVTRERARELAGVGGVRRLRDGWCVLDADGRVVFAVADNEVPLPTGGSRDEAGALATAAVRGSRY